MNKIEEDTMPTRSFLLLEIILSARLRGFADEKVLKAEGLTPRVVDDGLRAILIGSVVWRAAFMKASIECSPSRASTPSTVEITPMC